MPYKALMEAIELSKRGEIDRAMDLVEKLVEELPASGHEDVDAFLYFLLRSKDRLDDAVKLATRRLDVIKDDEGCSLWSLRRGMLQVELENGRGAIADFNTVLRLNTNDYHTRQARRALLKVAGIFSN